MSDVIIKFLNVSPFRHTGIYFHGTHANIRNNRAEVCVVFNKKVGGLNQSERGDTIDVIEG